MLNTVEQIGMSAQFKRMKYLSTWRIVNGTILKSYLDALTLHRDEKWKALQPQSRG